MSIFKKLLLTLILILIIQIILICIRYKIAPDRNTFDINKPKNNYIIVVGMSSITVTVFK